MPVVTYDKKKAGGFVASALPLLRDVADRMQVSFSTSPKIIFANLSYLGVVTDAVLTDVIGHVSDCINVDIKNSCAIIVMPTVGHRGDCRNPQSIKTQERDIEDKLDSEASGIMTRRVTVMFNKDRVNSNDRQLVHNCQMAISNKTEKGIDGKEHPVSTFVHCDLWKFRAIGPIPQHPFRDYTSPFRSDVCNTDSYALSPQMRLKQLMTGPALYSELLTNVVQNIKIPTGSGILALDVVPYDGTLPKTIYDINMSQALQSARLGCASISCCQQADGDVKVRRFVHVSERNHALEQFKSTGESVRGLKKRDLPSASSTRPTVTRDKFKLLVVSGDLSLQIPEEVYQEWSACEYEPIREQWKHTVEEHNKEFNVAGRTYKDAKRTRTGADDIDGTQAPTLPQSEGEATTLDEIKAKYGEVTVSPSGTPEFSLVFTKCSTPKVFIHALQDGTITENAALGGLGGGSWLVDKPGKELMAVEGPPG